MGISAARKEKILLFDMMNRGLRYREAMDALGAQINRLLPHEEQVKEALEYQRASMAAYLLKKYGLSYWGGLFYAPDETEMPRYAAQMDSSLEYHHQKWLIKFGLDDDFKP